MFIHEIALVPGALARRLSFPSSVNGPLFQTRNLPRLRRASRGFLGASLLFFLLSGSGVALADSLVLRGGEKLIGRVILEGKETIVFESQTLGTLTVARGSIESLERSPASALPGAPSTNQPTAAPGPGLALTNQFLPWTSAPPKSRALDWIQLKSGEWLAGKIKSLQDDKLEFDSEELDVHVFDWKDIRTLRSGRLLSVGFEKRKPEDGSLLVTTNQVLVTTATTTNVYPRAELLAIAPTGARELNKWSGKISAGASFRAGNTREAEFNTHAALLRRTPSSRLSLDYLGNYGQVNGIETEENHRFIGQFDYFLSASLCAAAGCRVLPRPPSESRTSADAGGWCRL